jgi:two-component system OmpR family sensor kinase
MKQEGEKLQHQLIQLHRKFDAKLPIYVKKNYKIALLDKRREKIFSTFDLPREIDFDQPYQIINGHLLYIKPIDPYHLGVAYLLIWTPVDRSGIAHLQKTILLFMLGGGLFFLVLGYYLGRLFVAPMRESIGMMNDFIQDTTHELNTPISTILTNLELIGALHKCNAKKEMQRIEIASKTLSRIYDDLTYLKLNQDYHRDIRPIDISRLLQERILYFSAAIEAKRIKLQERIEEDVIISIDRDDAIRLIDNLISNAIKYNKSGGTLEVRLDRKELRVRDSGIGIEKKELATIYERFKRANKSEGGFGIGLNIVYQLIQLYDFSVSIDSKPDIGTEVTIKWQK